MTPNGKVDRKTLPAPKSSERRQILGGEPVTKIEIRLAEIWEEVLNVPSVRLDDDFFDLGGHSMLAVKMIARLNESLGYDIPLAALFESPTLAGLAKYAERSSSQQRVIRTVIPIRKSGSKPPLFCVSRPNVNALGFIFLSRALSKDQPVFGLQSHMETDGAYRPFEQAEYDEKASAYIAAMREVQPTGPYFLIGFCEGAHIAFEMARQLEAANQTVGMLAILDAWPVENTIDRRRFYIRSYGNIVRRFLRSDNSERLSMISRKLRGLPALPPSRSLLTAGFTTPPNMSQR